MITHVGYTFDNTVGLGGLSGLGSLASLGNPTPPGNVLIGASGAALGSGVMAMAPWLAPLLGVGGPFTIAAGAIIIGVSSLLSALGVGSGCGQTCVVASNVVDQLEPYLKQNLSNWNNLPASEKTLANKEIALNVFNTIWQQVLQNCGNVTLGEAGRNCISERSRGGKWDWFKYYYDPIVNDSSMVMNNDTNSIISQVEAGMGIGPGIGGSNTTLFLGIGILLIGYMVAK